MTELKTVILENGSKITLRSVPSEQFVADMVVNKHVQEMAMHAKEYWDTPAPEREPAPPSRKQRRKAAAIARKAA